MSPDINLYILTIKLQNGPWLDAHDGMQAVLDYYKEVFNRNSYDDKGSPIRQFVNVQDGEGGTDGASSNAAALNACYLVDEKYPGMGQYAFDFMMYGCGDSDLSSVIAFDVLAHEYTHLVTGYNGNGGLEYQGESGAINEAYSDVMACAIGHNTGLDTNWLIGDNIVANDTKCLRDMSNPKTA